MCPRISCVPGLASLLLLAVIAGSGSSGATYIAVRPETPPPAFEATSEVCDVGQVPQGMVSATFELVNRTAVPVRIEFVQGEAATRSFRLIPKDPASGPIIEKASCSHKAFRVASQTSSSGRWVRPSSVGSFSGGTSRCAAGPAPALPAGIWHWQEGRFDLLRVNPPLVRSVAALPVLALRPEVNWGKFQDPVGIRSEFEVGHDFVQHNGDRSFRLFTVARRACIPFSILGALVCYGWALFLSARSVALARMVVLLPVCLRRQDAPRNPALALVGRGTLHVAPLRGSRLAQRNGPPRTTGGRLSARQLPDGDESPCPLRPSRFSLSVHLRVEGGQTGRGPGEAPLLHHRCRSGRVDRQQHVRVPTQLVLLQ